MSQRGKTPNQVRRTSSPHLVHESLQDLRAETKVIDSDASSGGSATETMTFTGLKADDEILAVTQKVSGSLSAVYLEFLEGTQADDAMDIRWDGDPGSGAVIRLLVRRKLFDVNARGGVFQ